MASIVTLTLNPALDVSTAVDVVTPTHKLRCDPARVDAGGGGVNVARVCDRLGRSTLAVLPIAGATGSRLARELEAEGVDFLSIDTRGETRQSFSVYEKRSGQEYRFVVPGGDLAPDDLDRCRDAALDTATEARCLVVSGSMPGGIPSGFIRSIIEAVPEVDVVVDTSGDALAEAIMSPARLVKPSARELSAVVGRELMTEADIEAGALELMATAQCRALVVSIGAGGAIVIDHDAGLRRYRAPTVRVVSAVGAGDSMVAGMTAVLATGGSIHDAIQLGIAAGTATVMTPGSQLCHRDAVEEMLTLVERDNPR